MNDEHDRRRRGPMSDSTPSGGWQMPDDEPVNLSEVNFDDAYLDSLSRDLPTPTRDSAEYELAGLLSSWRHEVLAEPLPPLPGVEEVERAIAAEQPVRRANRVVRTLRVVAGAAAIAVVAAAGLTVMSERAQPGDPLWGVKKVVFAQAASETQAAYDVRSDLERAEAQLAAGNTAEAQQLIARAQNAMGPVRDSSTRADLDDRINRLRADAGTVTSTPGGGAPAVPGPDGTLPETSDAPDATTLTSVPTTDAPVTTAPTTSPTTTTSPTEPGRTPPPTSTPASSTRSTAPATTTTTTTTPVPR
ncbi:anti-sigma-D factor RsdA [Gordonia sp. NPDC003429]